MVDIEAIAGAARYRAKLIIDVSNKRPAKPRFARRAFYARVTENNSIGTFLRNVRVRYPAKNSITRPTQIFVAGALKNIISVDSQSGRTVALISFDREKQQEYSFTLGLRYIGESLPIDTAQLVISVIDRNDNPPRFRTPKNIQFSISENATVGAFIGRLTATDADRGQNSRVTYEQVSLRHSWPKGVVPFELMNDGTIYLRGRLDREHQASYKFVVKATDHGRPRLSSTATVTVKVSEDCFCFKASG